MKIPLLHINILTDKQLAQQVSRAKKEASVFSNKIIAKLLQNNEELLRFVKTLPYKRMKNYGAKEHLQTQNRIRQ